MSNSWLIYDDSCLKEKSVIFLQNTVRIHSQSREEAKTSSSSNQKNAGTFQCFFCCHVHKKAL